MVIFGLNKERATDKRRVAEQITEIRQIIINKSHILGLWTEGDSDRKKMSQSLITIDSRIQSAQKM